MGEATISEKTKISLGTVIIIIAAAISYGVMYEKVLTVENNGVLTNSKMDRLTEKVDTLVSQKAISINTRSEK